MDTSHTCGKMFNIYSCCRLCLKQGVSGLVNCIEIEELSKSIDNLFMFKILPTDDCSTKICRECICKVTNYSMYRNDVLNNQKSIQQYRALQEKLGFSMEIKQEGDDDVILVSEDLSKCSTAPKFVKPLNVLANSSYSVSCKTYARKSTAKPLAALIRKNNKLKKLKIMCRKLKESDVLSVVLKDKDKKILNLKGKPPRRELYDKVKVARERHPIYPANENKEKTNNIISDNHLAGETPEQSKNSAALNRIKTLLNSIETPSVPLNMSSIIDSALKTSLNRPIPPLHLQNVPNYGWQNTATDQQNGSCSSGLFYIKPMPTSTTKVNKLRPILPKAQLPIAQIADKMSTNTSNSLNTSVSTTPCITPISAHLPVISDVFNNYPNISNLTPSFCVKKTMPTQNTSQYNQNNDNKVNLNNFVYVRPRTPQMQDKSPVQSNINSSYTCNRPFKSIATVSHPNTVSQHYQNIKLGQKRQNAVKPGSVVTSTTQINSVPTPADEYIPVEQLAHQRNLQITQMNRPGPYLPTKAEVKTTPSLNTLCEADSVTSSTIIEPINAKRVKVLSVNELNMRATEVSHAENRKLPIRITLVKIRNEVQIKLTDSKGNEIHYTDLAPQEQSAVRCSLLQPASKEQILNAIKTCMPDKYSQDMLKTLGITIRGSSYEV